jgi:hypothetical protein
MGLSLADHQAVLSGFASAGFVLLSQPNSPTNPIRVEWRANQQTLRFRLWSFEITHGGGGSNVRAADEFRVQITNGPDSMPQFNSGGAVDLLLGYSRTRDVIVAYDRRWLEAWTKKKEATGSGGSPSVQVKEADMQAGGTAGIYHLVKSAAFGTGHILTLRPAYLPAYLLNYTSLLQGTMNANQASAAMPQVASENVVEYCRRQGFPFDPDLLARYLASLQAKPFVILAGVSGTGKSKLAELVAEFYTRGQTAQATVSPPSIPAFGSQYVYATPQQPAPDRTRFALVPVRPDWIDGQSIIGFVNPITESYESTQALDLILRAHRALSAIVDKAQAERYFLLLDEMNLARVEHYFSDWLACAESRRARPDGSIIQQPVPLHRAKAPMHTTLQRPDGSTETLDVPASLELPINLVITGTVNVDETTYGLSPKVLDRAMVLEFDDVDLERLRTANQPAPANAYRFPAMLKPYSLPSAADYEHLPQATHELLKTLNGILEEARLHFGYRAANELALFMSIYNEILPPDPQDVAWLRALDIGVLQKVLPRLSGSRAKLEAALTRVCGFLRDLQAPSDLMAELDPNSMARLPRSYRRALDMLQALRDFGFVSFFK